MASRKKKNRQATARRNEIAQGGEPKMSAVILKLAEPLLQQVRDNPKRAEMVVTLAIAAWNKAMLPVEKQPGIEKEIIDTLVPKGGRAEDVGVICEVMDAIEERRKKLFPKLRRYIATHDFKMSHGKMMLNVGSAIIPAER